MPKQPYMPNSDAGQVQWLNRFVNALQNTTKGYATKYNISTATVTRLDQGRQLVEWIWDRIDEVRTASQQCTAAKNQIFAGQDPLGTLPPTPVFPDPPSVPRYAGVMTFAASVGNSIKQSANYSVTDGQDLGLEGAVITDAGAETGPLLTIKKSVAGDVQLGWLKKQHQAMKVQWRIAGTAEWLDAGLDLNPPYVDTRPLAHPGTAEVREYRACYVDDEVPTNLWGPIVSVTVTP